MKLQKIFQCRFWIFLVNVRKFILRDTKYGIEELLKCYMFDDIRVSVAFF